MRPLLPTTVFALLGCAGAGTKSTIETTVAPDASEAQRLLDSGNVDEALSLTDRIIARDSMNRAAHRIAAHGNFALFREGRTHAQLFLLDAIRSMETALNLDGKDGDGWLSLSEWHLANSDFDAGIAAGRRAFREFEAAAAPNDRKAAALLSVADNQMQYFVEARRAELAEDAASRPEDETIRLANEVLATAQASLELGATGPASRRCARVYRWLDRQKEALEALERAIVADPTAGEVHDEFRNIYFASGDARACVGAYRRMLRTHGDNPILRWHLGRTQAAAADELRKKQNFDRATHLYGDAISSFTDCAASRPGFKDSCDQWRALCELSLGRIAFDSGDHERAIELYEQAAATHPSITAYDGYEPRMWDGLQKHYIGNLFTLGQKLIEDEGLEAGLAHYERIIERHRHETAAIYSSIYNNAALCARDLGVEIADRGGDESARRADVERAMSLWEKSYAYYEKAVELEPADPRTVNDCGLMLVYHLHRGYDRARECFDRAIELGETQLAEVEDDDAKRRWLEEAIGDAYENIGVMLEQQNRPSSEVASFYEKAIQFYPGANRNAARKLKSMRQAHEATSAIERQDPRKKTFDAAVKDAVAHADTNDWDSALLVLDKLAKEMKGFAPYHHRVGLYSMRYAQAQAQESGADAGLIQGLFADAVTNLTKATELDAAAIEPQLHLGEALIATGAFKRAQSVLSALVENDALTGDAAVAAHGFLATAAAQVYITAKSSNQDDADALAMARKSFGVVEASRPLTQSERSDWVNVERWAGNSKAAVGVLVRAYEKAPDDVIDQLVTTGYHVGENQAVVNALAERNDAFGVWYRGKALYYRALSEWSGSDAEKAIKTFGEALAEFEKSEQLNASYKDSCDEWAAFCLGSRGLAEISIERFEPAEQTLLEALRRKPSALTSDLGNGSIKRGIMMVGHHYFSSGRLGDAADLYIAVGKIAGDDVDLSNNEGLFARDYGARLSRSGKDDDAKPYFEASYAAYTRASNADPTNVRLRNDRALLLIYHLGRELDLAKRLLESAIRDGEATLAENPPDDADELRNLQEAVGDCYQNLGVYYLETVKDLEKARSNFESSLTFYPFNNRASARHLRRVEQLERERKDR